MGMHQKILNLFDKVLFKNVKDMKEKERLVSSLELKKTNKEC
jgi:hypothetical protein